MQQRHMKLFGFAIVVSVALALAASGCKDGRNVDKADTDSASATVLAPEGQVPARPWIQTRQELTLFSANDGQAHIRLDAEMRIDKKSFAPDSITVVYLGPDHPPLARTVYGTAPNTIIGAPYQAITKDGHYAFVICHGLGLFAPKEKNLLSVIDLSSPDLVVVQKVNIPSPSMVLAHPDGRHVIVAYPAGFEVFEMHGGRLVLVKDNQVDLIPDSMDISPKGDRIVATVLNAPDGYSIGVHVFSYQDGVIEHQHEVHVPKGLTPFDKPFAMRFSPDGKRVLVPNGGGMATKGRLDDVLSVDMTLDPPAVTEVIPQVADGIESLAFHPEGHMAVIACLEDLPWSAASAYSHLAVIDLTSQPARVLYDVNVESFPEGIEFTPDGSQLFVQLTSANHIAVFDVDGFMLKRSPFVIRVGHGPSSMGIGPRFMK
jgi:DNA-binding beta-propeller fold protein YncE